MSFTIAIDGPAGAGKSTIAKLVAKELECIYVDTGAMYRALALYMVRKGVDIHDEKKVEAELAGADVSLMYDKGELKVMLNGENVAGIIRTPEVSEAASVVSAGVFALAPVVVSALPPLPLPHAAAEITVVSARAHANNFCDLFMVFLHSLIFHRYTTTEGTVIVHNFIIARDGAVF